MGSIASKCAEEDELIAWKEKKAKEEKQAAENRKHERFEKILSDFGYHSSLWLGGMLFTNENDSVFGIKRVEGKYYRSAYGDALKGLEVKTEEQLTAYCDISKKLDKARRNVEKLELEMKRLFEPLDSPT